MKIIHSENPLDHWNDWKTIQDKIVLDFGCGWLKEEFDSTPEYFIKNGCKHLIGVDSTSIDINSLQKLYPNHTFITKVIRNKEDITDLLEQYKPNLVKMDIEGYESLIENIDKKYFESVDEVMIEYHNNICRKILDIKLPEYGLEIKNINRFGYVCTDPNIMGVIYASR